jgi:4-amino-4-deoxy-L-arabinose transferase-like glycosyltransferase
LIISGKEKHSLKIPVTLAFFFALLCLLGLNEPLNGDEAKTYLEHVASSPFQLLIQYVGPNQHTLFSILSNTSMRIFGEHEVAFRIPVFLAAILSIFLIHRLGSLWNSTTATVASLLMMGSYHHLIWAQSGRGYALTELLALASVYGTILLLEGKSFKRGAWVLVFSGIALCLTIPSNSYFLPGCGLAFVFVLWESRNSKIPISWFHLGKKLLPFIFLAVSTAGYFFLIYDDLARGIETYKDYFKQFKNVDSLMGIPQQFQEIARDLARPWGLWFYLPVLYGLWTLNRTQRGFFLILLGTPALLMVLSGIIGPPRVYVYALPFFILLAALGIDRGIRSLSRFMPRYFNKALPATLGLVFLIPSIFHVPSFQT